MLLKDLFDSHFNLAKFSSVYTNKLIESDRFERTYLGYQIGGKQQNEKTNQYGS